MKTSTLNHTTGPWNRRSYSDGRTVIEHNSDHRSCSIAELTTRIGSLEHESNARLIAKAPDLLAQNKRLREALQAVINVVTHPLSTKPQMRIIANEARAALNEPEVKP